MSTTSNPAARAKVIEDAVALRALFPESTYQRWHLAGSVRRGKPEVADVDHVVIPNTGDVPSDDLYHTPEAANLFWRRLDELVAAGTVTKHLYGAAEGYRWGPLLRGIDFRGHKHEFWTADAQNLGSVMAIRTGPAEYSQMLVVALQRNGFWNRDGYVWNKRDLSCACGWRGSASLHAVSPEQVQSDDVPKYIDKNDAALLCPKCRRGAGLSMALVPVPEEEDYFRLCNVTYTKPQDRRPPAPR